MVRGIRRRQRLSDDISRVLDYDQQAVVILQLCHGMSSGKK